MAQWVKRTAAGLGALLFLVTSLSLTILVIINMSKQNKTDTSAQQPQDSSTAKLAGTKLLDFTPVAKVDSLQVIDTTPGTGDEVKAGDTITALYTGALAADGTIFDSSTDHGGQPASFPLSGGPDGVIEGWVQGVPGMKVGGTRRLLIPAVQAYGADPPQGIPANADLVFDVQVLKIGQ